MKYKIAKHVISGRKKGKVFSILRNFDKPEDALGFMHQVNTDPKSDHKVLSVSLVAKPNKYGRKSI